MDGQRQILRNNSNYMSANPIRSESTNQLYNYEAKHYLGDWLSRPLDSITRRDGEARFKRNLARLTGSARLHRHEVGFRKALALTSLDA